MTLIGFLPGFFLQKSWISGSSFFSSIRERSTYSLSPLQQGDVGGAHVTLHPIKDQSIDSIAKASAGFMSFASFSQEARPIPAVVNGSAQAGAVRHSKHAATADSP
jgi:hypothetical protein